MITVYNSGRNDQCFETMDAVICVPPQPQGKNWTDWKVFDNRVVYFFPLFVCLHFVLLTCNNGNVWAFVYLYMWPIFIVYSSNMEI